MLCYYVYMTNLELLKENSSFLLQPVEEKPYNNSLSSQKIGYHLLDFMYSNDGIGLSANQVGFNHRIFVMGDKNTQCICWNPYILEYSDELVEKMEGCLSFPNLFLKIKRSEHIKVRYINEYGLQVTRNLSDIWSHCFQHELDHLDGILFTHKISKLKLDIALKKRRKLQTKGK